MLDVFFVKIGFFSGDWLVLPSPSASRSSSGTTGASRRSIPEGTWTNDSTDQKLSGGPTRLTDLLKLSPVALLNRE